MSILVELPQHRQDLRRGRPAGDRRAGARREGRVEAVDVEGDIGLLAAGALGDRIGDVGGAHLLDLVAVEDLDAEILRRMGADADLDRAVGIDDALLARRAPTKEPWSMRLPSSGQVS